MTGNANLCNVKVSVVMLTYNHEAFVAQAIESVVMQQTEFSYELVIGDDCSTDGTRFIICAYAERYPDRIRLLVSERNKGVIPNLVTTLEVAHGEFVAFCEGDDYWTDPLKLQKQVNFLEAHPECTICFHDVLKVYQDGSRPSFRFGPPENKQVFVLEDVLKSTISQTASMVFRRDALPDFPDWFNRATLGDWALSVLLAEHGSIGYLRELMSVWRVHKGGVWTGIPERHRLEQMLQTYDLFDSHFGYRYTAILETPKAMCHYGLALDCWLKGLQEEQAHWLTFVTESYPRTAEPLVSKVVGAAHEIESSYGHQRAENAVGWICDAIRQLTRGSAWCKKVRVKWYAGCAFEAHKRGDKVAVRCASWRAVVTDWRILGNRGFVWRWLVAIVGDRTWVLLRQLASKASTQPDERSI